MNRNTAESYETQQMQWSGIWDQIVGRVRETWGELTDDDVNVARGDLRELKGRIKQRTGETAEAVERRFQDWGWSEEEEEE